MSLLFLSERKGNALRGAGVFNHSEAERCRRNSGSDYALGAVLVQRGLQRGHQLLGVHALLAGQRVQLLVQVGHLHASLGEVAELLRQVRQEVLQGGGGGGLAVAPHGHHLPELVVQRRVDSADGVLPAEERLASCRGLSRGKKMLMRTVTSPHQLLDCHLVAEFSSFYFCLNTSSSLDVFFFFNFFHNSTSQIIKQPLILDKIGLGDISIHFFTFIKVNFLG